MSTHPNVLLILDLQPEDLPMKTWRAIMEDYGLGPEDDFKIGGERFYHKCLEGDFDEGWQISGKSGDIVVLSLVTYGYGEYISFDRLTTLKQALQEWGEAVAEKYKCKVLPIRVSANYW